MTHDHDAPQRYGARSRAAIAARIAELKAFEWAGNYDPSARYDRPLYFVPSETIIGLDVAARLGIRSEDDLFGGVVPSMFMGTKTITHPLVSEQASAPPTWSHDFADRVFNSVLRGYTAFTKEDARHAGSRLLEHGPTRIKLARGIGGRGQFVVDGIAELARIIDTIDDDEIATAGVVLEEHLEGATTYSVGRVCIAGITATYWGTQRMTKNNRGVDVYGGSDLVVVRGDFDALEPYVDGDATRAAIAHARIYDDAARACFDGFFASRRNYDVVHGADALGHLRVGVLEQSWRVGGASGAEIEALLAFRDDPTLHVVRARTVEVYGDASPPDGATVLYSGVDEKAGPLTLYAEIERDGDA